MSVPIATTGCVPITISSSGVISDPPPIPVRPTRIPTPWPKTMISGSIRARSSTEPVDNVDFGPALQSDLLRLDGALAPGRMRGDRDRQILDRQPGAVEQRHGVGVRAARCRAGEHRAQLGHARALDRARLDGPGQLAAVRGL